MIWRAQMIENYVAWLILMLSSHTFFIWKENSYKCIFSKVRGKNNSVQTFLALL